MANSEDGPPPDPDEAPSEEPVEEPEPPISEEELRAAACWFNVDRVASDPVMTAFKRRARWRQAQWRGDLAMGSHSNTRKNIDAGRPPRIDNGVNLVDSDGHLGRNFLSPEIFEVAKTRIRDRQRRETLNPTRLRNDMLSSMPMCFNLFGELAGDPEQAQTVAAALLGRDPGSPTTVSQGARGS